MKRLHLTLAAVAWASTVLIGCSRSGGDNKPAEIAQVNVKPEAKESAADPLGAFGGLRARRSGDEAIINAEMAAQSVLDSAQEPWNPKVNDEKVRSIDDDRTGERVYQTVSPSVVVVKTKTGHGTGFFINDKGWVMTNHHVIAGARLATIYMGKLNADGVMELVEEGLHAAVYCSSKEKDLAILHLANPTQKYPALKFAAKVPPAQHRCYAIGHPMSGLLWSVREGKVAQVGLWPRDGVGMLSKRVSANAKDVDEMTRTMSKSSQMKILLSNCGINSGDSGGPLVNTDGELVSVSFAMPSDPGSTSFAYHIHLDEVNKFLQANEVVGSRPAGPAAEAVDPWPTGAYLDLIDLDGDGTPDALGISKTKGGPLTGVLLDLRQENKIKTLADLGDQPKNWRFSLAIHFRPQPTAYYDTKMNGTIDLVMTEKEPGGAIQIKRLENGQWVVEDGGRRPLYDAILFPDRAVRERLTLFAKKIQDGK